MSESFAGARWWKVDFHTHTPASLDTRPWQDAMGTSDEVTPEKWLRKYMEAGIDAVAVTDHNSGAWIDELKGVYLRLEAERPPYFRELVLFPGVEFSVTGGIHLLALFDPSATTSDIDSLLGQVEYDGTKGDPDGRTRKAILDVIDAIYARNGLAVPAHVDREKGLLETREGKPDAEGRTTRHLILDPTTVRHVLESPNILAMEKLEPGADLSQVFVNVDPPWARVVGSDCHNFRQGPLPGSRYTWVKMVRPSLEGLQLAFLDGNRFSVQCFDEVQGDPNNTPNNWIRSIEIEKARYMGNDQPLEIPLSPWLNALVGGRGTGKSTVVHFLRAALDRGSEVSQLNSGEARAAFESFLTVPKGRDGEGGLRNESAVRIRYSHDRQEFRVCWASDGSRKVEQEDVGDSWKPSLSQEIRNRLPIRIFSQGQILELAGNNQSALLEIIDQAAECSGDHRALQDLEARFLAVRAKQRELKQKLTAIDRVRGQLADVSHKLELLEASQSADVLRQYQLRSRQIREVGKLVDEVATLTGELSPFSERFATSSPPEGLFAASDLADTAVLEAWMDLQRTVQTELGVLSESIQRLAAAATAFQDKAMQGGLGQKAAEAGDRYNSMVAELAAQGVKDPTEFGKLLQQRQQIEEELNQLESLSIRLNELERDGSDILAESQARRRALTARREKFLADTLEGSAFVRIRVDSYGRDARVAEPAFRELIDVRNDRFSKDILNESNGGLLAEIYRDLPDGQENSEIEQRLEKLKASLAACAAGDKGDLDGKFSNYLGRFWLQKPEMLDRWMLWFPEDGLRIEYSPKGNGREFRSISQSSPGQRSAAMLAFFLAFGSQPIVLDQPEDDLDNQLIYELLVHQLRERKRERQVIVVTHNPNIVVNGDAEMIHVFDSKRGQCRVAEKGSLQESRVRQEVCRVMEGGNEAFDRRYRRLRNGGERAR